MIQKDMPDCQCPICSHVFNAVTSVERPEPPVPGDITICIECASVLEFDMDLKVKLLSEETRSDLTSDNWAEISRTVEIVKRASKISRKVH